MHQTNQQQLNTLVVFFDQQTSTNAASARPNHQVPPTKESRVCSFRRCSWSLCSSDSKRSAWKASESARQRSRSVGRVVGSLEGVEKQKKGGGGYSIVCYSYSSRLLIIWFVWFVIVFLFVFLVDLLLFFSLFFLLILLSSLLLRFMLFLWFSLLLFLFGYWWCLFVILWFWKVVWSSWRMDLLQ